MVRVLSKLEEKTPRDIAREVNKHFGMALPTFNHIYNGRIKTVPKNIEDFLYNRLSKVFGLSDSELEKAIKKFYSENKEERRVPISSVMHILKFMKKNFGMGYTALLGYNVRASMNTITEESSLRALRFYEQTKGVLSSKSVEAIRRFKANVYGTLSSLRGIISGDNLD